MCTLQTRHILDRSSKQPLIACMNEANFAAKQLIQFFLEADFVEKHILL